MKQGVKNIRRNKMFSIASIATMQLPVWTVLFHGNEL